MRCSVVCTRSTRSPPTFLELVAAAPAEDATAGRAGLPGGADRGRQGEPFDQVARDRDRDARRRCCSTERAPGRTRECLTGSSRLTAGNGSSWVAIPRRTTTPRADVGLVIEAGRSGHLGLPEEAFIAPADIRLTPNRETMVRIVAREYLVDDLDETLRVLERNLRWTPESCDDEAGMPPRGHAVSRAAQRAASSWCEPIGRRAELRRPTRSWGPGRGPSGSPSSMSTPRHPTSRPATHRSPCTTACSDPRPPRHSACRSNS